MNAVEKLKLKLNFPGIDQYVKELIAAKDAYYNTGSSLMTDQEFDLKMEYLKENYPARYPEVAGVGHETTADNKIKFQHKMLSLDKVKGTDAIQKWWTKNPVPQVITWKLDGCAMQLKYAAHTGNLVYAALRGDGELGADVTAKAPYIQGIPMELREYQGPWDMYVIGEVVISLSDFLELNKNDEFVNPRNLANGALNEASDPQVCQERKTRFVAHRRIHKLGATGTYMDSLASLEHLGFERVVAALVESEEKMISVYQDHQRIKDDADLPIDGLVSIINDVSQWPVLGESNSAPRYAVALKFPDEEKNVIVKEIDWTVSRNGIITPQAVFEPVFLGGANIGRASLHNYGTVKDMQIANGDTIRICRSNEVIPYVLHVVAHTGDGFMDPDVCPCPHRAPVESDGVRLYCRGTKCSFKIIHGVDHLLKVLDSAIGLAEKSLQVLVDSGEVNSIPDVFKIEARVFVETLGWNWDHAINMKCKLDGLKNPTLPQYIQCLGLKFGGRRFSERIAKQFSTFQALDMYIRGTDTSNIQARPQQPESMGPNQWNDFQQDYRERGYLLHLGLKEAGFWPSLMEYEDETASLVCITGKLSKSRKEMEVHIKELGFRFTNKLTREVDYLVVGEKSGSKLSKAEKLGVYVIKESDLDNIS